MIKKSLLSGLIAGLILTGLFFISHLLFMKNMTAQLWTAGLIVGYSIMIIALTAVFFGIKSYRDKVLGGKIKFSKAFLLGMGITTVAGVIFGIYVYVLYVFISPDLSDRLIDAYRERIKTSGETEQVINEDLAKFETESVMWKNTPLQSFVTFMTIFMLGLPISLISAAILKRREPLLEN